MQHVVAMIVGCVTPAIIISGAIPGGLSREEQVILIQSALADGSVVYAVAAFSNWRKSQVCYWIRIAHHHGSKLCLCSQYAGNRRVLWDCSDYGSRTGRRFCGCGNGIAGKEDQGLFSTIDHWNGCIYHWSVIISHCHQLHGWRGQQSGLWLLAELAIAFFTLIVVTVLNHFGKGIWKLASILIGIIAGYLVAIPFGMVDFSSIGEAGVCQLPSLLHFGIEFEPSSCIAIGILFAINSIQAIGDYSATTIGAMDRTPKDEELQKGIIGYGISNIVGALAGGLPTATYSQNVGIVTTTKVINRWVLGLAAVILGIAGIVPKFSAILTTIPQCVLGGATVSVFASIAMTGMKLVASAEMDYRNSSIVGLAAALGMGVSQATAALAGFPAWVTTIFGKSPVVLATIIAVIMNIILPKTREEEKEEAQQKIEIKHKLDEDHKEFGE